MGFRLQKRIRIFKGLTLNLSKSGTSWTLGHWANGGRWVWWLGSPRSVAELLVQGPVFG